MKKVYLFLADGFETIEALTVVDILRRAGIDIETVSVSGRLMVTSAHKIHLQADQIFESCDFADASMLVLPGGIPGTPNLEAHKGLMELVLESSKKNIKLAAICAAPSIFGKLGLLEGKNATSYPGFDKELLDANVLDAKVVVDGNYITARGMGVTIEFALTILHELGYMKEAEQVGNAIQFTQYYK